MLLLWQHPFFTFTPVPGDWKIISKFVRSNITAISESRNPFFNGASMFCNLKSLFSNRLICKAGFLGGVIRLESRYPWKKNVWEFSSSNRHYQKLANIVSKRIYHVLFEQNIKCCSSNKLLQMEMILFACFCSQLVIWVLLTSFQKVCFKLDFV